MITKEKCINYILQKVPEFQNSWEIHLNYWESEEAGLCNDVSSFARFTIEKTNSKNQELLNTVFAVAEELLIDGDEDVRTAVATCFLENLLNGVSAGTISNSSFLSFLGENSKKHCRKWDEFTGVKTIGL